MSRIGVGFSANMRERREGREWKKGQWEGKRDSGAKRTEVIKDDRRKGLLQERRWRGIIGRTESEIRRD